MGNKQARSEFLISNPVKLGGQGIICQIDESMFRYKQKYHTGRISQQNPWIFGIIETGRYPSKFYVQIVPDWTKRTLLPIIQRICKAGTIIWSDEFRSYRSLQNDLTHLTVNHTLNFVNPVNSVHTQNIESLWGLLKYKIKKMRGISTETLENYLNFWIWKRNNGNDFEDLINLFIYFFLKKIIQPL